MSLKHSVTVSSGQVMGENSPNQLYIQKIDERLAFERSATQIYEALIKKIENGNQETQLTGQLRSFQVVELRHCQLLTGVRTMFMENHGLNLTDAPQTGPMSVWVEVIENSATSIADSLEALLQMEQVDKGGWELLIELSEDIGLPEVAIQFQQALNEENEHLQTIKEWVQEINLRELRH